MHSGNQYTEEYTSKESDKNNIAAWRQYLKDGFSAIKADFLKKPNNTHLFRQHCKLIDRLLITIWSKANIDESCCLIAVGGYGRGELYPYSDIDLLILLPDNVPDTEQSNSINNKLEALIGLLWDIGLNVGHSVRSLNECVDEAKKDITVQTNLLESRLLTGETNFYKSFLNRVNGTLEKPTDIANFFSAKLKEQNNRHYKFNDTAYNLEPNIKESPGGLRDIHMILWVTQCLNMGGSRLTTSSNTWALLTKQNIITPLEARQIQQHQRNLQLLRIRLHFLSNRREDRLLFDFQNELADSLGYVNTPRKRASEQMMQSYYRSVKFVSLINEVLLKSFQQMISTTPPVIISINEHFESCDQLLEAKTAGLLQQQPSSIFEAFLLLQKHPELKGMGATLLRNLQRVKRLVNRDFRQSQHNKKLFIEVLSQPNGVNHALRAMNRYGILGSYIPAFGKIIGQMQHDLFHVYTVDEHILNVLANLRRFAKPELKHEFPLCSQLFAEFDAPHLLYLAALFHDIAKGRGGDHSELGTIDAIRFCKLHRLPKADGELVAWLVAAHLKMSSTAQKSDLSDPAVIETFSHFVLNERRLIALYLLTVADIRGTSPLVWNAWKAKLLESLFNATKHALTNQLLYVQQAITTRKSEAAERLKKFGLSAQSYEHLWEKFGSSYFIRHESDEIAWHSRLLTPHLNTNQPIVRARLSPSGDGIQVMIYSKDQNDLFARICNFFDRMGYNIVEAKIYTTEHDYALDSFIVLDQSGKSVSYSGLLKFIEVELTQKLDKNCLLEPPLQGRISRQVKHMPILAQATITQEADNNNHKLEIIANDRPGLLATLAHQFLVHEIELHNAKINTLGNRAEDTFLISAKKGQKLDALRILALKEALISEI
ncbi:[protein-PII] uridylyltransferase [Methylotenera sp.]|uniref:[protein-PII] uridylyltransferase n=2 Tax=Methylotenera sp. TaxID=2051956 RepID=UPI00273110C6|nr:[protein-PII] uridylyltransferase [Methylotenera sp.]MDP2071512.1 [protein-PII] uridylyltransferase [Methylotenera sp.]MDP3004965.1 [protein-PII] uridylyltransferase [Methylotenera sp.]